MNAKKSNYLLPFIEESYRSEYTEWTRKNLRFSDAGIAAPDGQKCERAVYYDLTQPADKSLLTSGTLVLFDDGRLHEQDIRRRLRLVLRSPEREVADDDTGARGKIDNMVQVRSLPNLKDHSLCTPGTFISDPVLEIKTVNEYSFQAMAKSGLPDQNYYDQVQLYLYATKIQWAIILVKNRNSSGPDKGQLPFLEFEILADPERQQQLIAGFKTVNQCLTEKVIPPRPFLRESTQCSYCRYKHICWPQEIEAVPIDNKPVVDAPSQEILEGAVILATELKAIIAENEKQLAEAVAIIKRYFEATKAESLSVGHYYASAVKQTRKGLNKEYLQKVLSIAEFLEISEPKRELLEKAIADRKLDASILEEATKVVSETMWVKVQKKEDYNDQRVIRSTATSTPGTSTPGSKGKKLGRKRVSKRSRLLRDRSGDAGIETKG